MESSVNLLDILDWMNDEFRNGSRVKASKLYKLFCKHAKLQYPNVSEEKLRHPNIYRRCWQ